MKQQRNKNAPSLHQLINDNHINGSYNLKTPLEYPFIINWAFRNYSYNVGCIYEYIVLFHYSRLDMGVNEEDIFLRPKDIAKKCYRIPTSTFKRCINILVEHQYLYKQCKNRACVYLRLNATKFEQIIKEYRSP